MACKYKYTMNTNKYLKFLLCCTLVVGLNGSADIIHHDCPQRIYHIGNEPYEITCRYTEQNHNDVELTMQDENGVIQPSERFNFQQVHNTSGKYLTMTLTQSYTKAMRWRYMYKCTAASKTDASLLYDIPCKITICMPEVINCTLKVKNITESLYEARCTYSEGCSTVLCCSVNSSELSLRSIKIGSLYVSDFQVCLEKTEAMDCRLHNPYIQQEYQQHVRVLPPDQPTQKPTKKSDDNLGKY